MKEIEVVIHPDGSVSVEAHGYEGADCEEATRFIEQALGRPQQRKRKPEYYRQTAQRNRLRQKGG
jgi:acylphosphatase